MLAQEIKDQFDELFDEHQDLDVNVRMFIDHDHVYNIGSIDVFNDGVDQHLHSIDLNAEPVDPPDEVGLFYVLLDEIELEIIKDGDGNTIKFDNKEEAYQKVIGTPYQIITIPYSKI
ncbi:hypothetical protein ACKGJO_06815 [Gracilimonas sp. Q87]|uniref:hypothetical protein n=1 Tax=Gracilimonas sp. Q87 TaxID=3384766 RepID=UPI003984244A